MPRASRRATGALLRCDFLGALVHGAARSHLALCEVEDGGALSALGRLQQRTAAALLYIVAMRGDGENVNLAGLVHGL